MRNELFKKSALISAALHIAAVTVLFSKPLHLHHRFFSQVGKTPMVLLEEENIAILKRNLSLEEAFGHFEAPQKAIAAAMRRAEEVSTSVEVAPVFPPIALSLPSDLELPLPLLLPPTLVEEEIALTQPPALSVVSPELGDVQVELSVTGSVSLYEAPLPALSSPSYAPAASNFLPAEEKSGAVSVPLTAMAEMPTPESVQNLSPSLPPPTLCEIPAQKVTFVRSDFTISPSSPKSIKGIRVGSSLSEYGLPSIHLREWNEFFDVDVKTYAKEEGGFIFSVTVIPRVDLSEYRLKQNYLFLIDRSDSIDKHHYQTAKRAAARAIAALRPGDFFNVMILDGNVTSLSPEPLPFTKAHVQQAEDFLEKQSSHNHGPTIDVYTALTKVLSSEIIADEATTAILISGGDSPLKSSQQRKKINNWLEANRDRITLYTATAGYGNNLSSLKMLSLASRGTLLYSDTHAAFPRKLAKLVMDLRYPIAKEMNASIISTGGVELLPPSSRLPNLYSDHPYVLIGSSASLTEFTLLLEGKNKDQVFSIKKTISLSKAKQGSRLLLKQWAAEKAHALFDQYLREGESTLLQQAEIELGHDTQNSRR